MEPCYDTCYKAHPVGAVRPGCDHQDCLADGHGANAASVLLAASQDIWMVMSLEYKGEGSRSLVRHPAWSVLRLLLLRLLLHSLFILLHPLD
ncbi:hypothetical protein GY45DRAFT_1322411 [Cubamyces sp. BRFM 1775]|nr:hypothetical protein GY45DRAFT_1322411 [Cubamyces sp. BRFM 1775]